MDVKLAAEAGVCFGVARALATVERELKKTGKIYTYGPLINNRLAIESLLEKGVEVLDSLDGEISGTIILRSHGVAPEVYATLEEKGLNYIDCTCPDVKKIHELISGNRAAGRRIIIAGSAIHPEVIGAKGFAGEDCVVIEDEDDIPVLPEGKYALAAQTTFSHQKFDAIADALKKQEIDLILHDTICGATKKRQKSADELSRNVDFMLVIGDRSSSNTLKLYEICKKNCKNTYLIETIRDLELNIFSKNDIIGITAGASTPPAIVKEAFYTMSNLDLAGSGDSFEEMLNESLVTLHTGNIVKGTVINVSGGEVFVNLGYKSDGIIPKNEFSEDPNVDPAEKVKPGDEVEVFVIRVNDGDGNVLLSKKKVDSQHHYDELEAAFNSGEPLSGKVMDVVKGGLIALVHGVRVFIPSSQASNRYVEDLSVFKGQEFRFNIIEFDKSKRRFVAGRKALAAQEQREVKEKVFDSLEPGMKIDGTVSRVVDFGAFVDLGGVDGLIHISELSWGRIKRVKDVLAEGDNVTVTVLEMDRAKGKISLSLKDIDEDPWLEVAKNFPVGSIVTGKVVRMVPFGAFVELQEGIDGLIHISQISSKHVVKPEDELSIGQMIEVKITEIDLNTKRISLSKREADSLMVSDETVDEDDVEEEFEDVAEETEAEAEEVIEEAEAEVEEVEEEAEEVVEETEAEVEEVAAEVEEAVEEAATEAETETEQE
ncbi:MAG: bifunctional 4-hydroxy-3-methylbut-2-enyl diphosphate reductase/30S ribosomal protein S1 [Oscillospiraceae bacterium]|nr:bifunctional 4-hydroxy-3-methylbut-2-enyl diphosphate reductase/30S ribosomal protein S1 [Oscillospiraceae bacterium]